MLLNYLIVAVTHKKRIYLKVTMVHNTYTDQKPTDDKTGHKTLENWTQDVGKLDKRHRKTEHSGHKKMEPIGSKKI